MFPLDAGLDSFEPLLLQFFKAVGVDKPSDLKMLRDEDFVNPRLPVIPPIPQRKLRSAINLKFGEAAIQVSEGGVPYAISGPIIQPLPLPAVLLGDDDAFYEIVPEAAPESYRARLRLTANQKHLFSQYVSCFSTAHNTNLATQGCISVGHDRSDQVAVV